MRRRLARLVPPAAKEVLGDWAASLDSLTAQHRAWPPTAEARKEHRVQTLLRDLDGPLAAAEMLALYRRVRAAPPTATIVERTPGSGQVTCCLAYACLGTERRVHALWPASVADVDNEAGRRFVVWHQTVIRKHLVPHVVPVICEGSRMAPACPSPVWLLWVGADPSLSDLDLPPQDALAEQLRPGLVLGAPR